MVIWSSRGGFRRVPLFVFVLWAGRLSLAVCCRDICCNAVDPDRSRPSSGSLMLYSRKKVRYRRDGYCWKKRKDGKTTREDHMKLKVQGIEVRRLKLFYFTVHLTPYEVSVTCKLPKL